MWRALFEKLFLLKIWQCQKVQLPITEIYATADHKEKLSLIIHKIVI